MEVIPLQVVRYRMGAEELIELGRARALGASRSPFLANRPRFAMGHVAASPAPELAGYELGDILDIVKDVGGMITGALGFALSTLGDLVSVPLDILSKGVDLVFTNVAGLLDHIPIIGGLLAQILLLGNSVIKFALSVPGMLLHGLGNVMTGISKALMQKNTPAQNQKNVDKAKDDIIGKAPPNLASKVGQVLNSTGVTGNNLTPTLTPQGGVLPGGGTTVPTPAPAAGESGLSDVLAVGLPLAGVAAAALVFLR